MSGGPELVDHRLSAALFRVLGTLSQVKGPSESGWYKGKCPAHQDRRASLGVRDGKRGVILKCQAGCAPEEIVKRWAWSGVTSSPTRR